MTKKDITALVKEFKKLVKADVEGITSTDARNTITDWLVQLEQPELAEWFEESVYKYQTSKKIQNLIWKREA